MAGLLSALLLLLCGCCCQATIPTRRHSTPKLTTLVRRSHCWCRWRRAAACRLFLSCEIVGMFCVSRCCDLCNSCSCSCSCLVANRSFWKDTKAGQLLLPNPNGGGLVNYPFLESLRDSCYTTPWFVVVLFPSFSSTTRSWNKEIIHL